MNSDGIRLLIKHSKKLEQTVSRKIPRIITELIETAVKRRMPSVVVVCRCAAYLVRPIELRREQERDKERGNANVMVKVEVQNNFSLTQNHYC